jgi:hypothetical protein
MAGQSEYHRTRRRKLTAAGRCIWCKRRTTLVLCRHCAATQRERYEALREAGLCTRCGASADDHSWACEPCRDRINERRRERRRAR